MKLPQGQRARVETAAEAMGTSYSDLIRRGTLEFADMILLLAGCANVVGDAAKDRDVWGVATITEWGPERPGVEVAGGGENAGKQGPNH